MGRSKIIKGQREIERERGKSRRDGDEVRDWFISGSHWELLLFCC